MKSRPPSGSTKRAHRASPEPAGSYEAFRYFDAASGRIPDDEVARARQTRGVYLDAIRDWVANGPASRFPVYREDEAASKARVPTAEQAEAHARFRMGLHLLAQGNESEAHEFFARAIELNPDSWAMWRQAAPKLENGIAAGPEFNARVQALGTGRYYPQIDMEGVPTRS